jgi:hypothetical protein
VELHEKHSYQVSLLHTDQPVIHRYSKAAFSETKGCRLVIQGQVQEITENISLQDKEDQTDTKAAHKIQEKNYIT